MAIKSSSFEQKYYYGKSTALVLGFNPTKSELESWGFKPKDDISYEKDGKYRTTVYLKDAETNVIYTYTFFLENVDSVSEAKGKKQYINAAGQSWWNNEPTPIQSFQSDKGIRVAKKGEADLMKFIKFWQSAYDECQLEPSEVEAISKGDVTVLKALALDSKTKQVGILVGVQKTNEGKFYNKVGAFCAAKGKVDSYSKEFTRFIDNDPKNTTEYYFGAAPFTFTEVEDPSKLEFGAPTNAESLAQENEL